MIALLLLVAALPNGAYFAPDADEDKIIVHRGRALFVVEGEGLMSVDLATGAARTLLRSRWIADFAVDGDDVLAVDDDALHVLGPKPQRVAMQGARGVVACGGKRYVAVVRKEGGELVDVASKAIVAKGYFGELLCTSGVLTAARDRELLVLAPAAESGDALRGALPPRSATRRSSRTRRPAQRSERVPIEGGALAVPLGDGFLVANNTGALRVVDARGVTRSAVGYEGRASLSLSPDGKRALVGRTLVSLPDLRDVVVVRSVPRTATGVFVGDHLLFLTDAGLRERPVPRAPEMQRGIDDPTFLARTGDRVAIGQADGRVLVLRDGAGKLRAEATLDAHADSLDGVIGLGFWGDQLVTAGDDGFVHVFDKALRRTSSVMVNDRGRRGSFALDAARGLVAIGGSQEVAIVDLNKGAVARVLGPYPRENMVGIVSMAFSPRGDRFAFVDDGDRTRVVSLNDGKELARYAERTEAVGFDAQGRLLRATDSLLHVEGASPRATPMRRASRIHVTKDDIWLSDWGGEFARVGDREARRGPWHVSDLVVDGDRVLTIGPDEQLLSWPKRGGAHAALYGVKRARVEAVTFVDDAVAVALDDARVRLVKQAGAPRDLIGAKCNDKELGSVWVIPEKLARYDDTLVGVGDFGAARWSLSTGVLTCPKRMFDSLAKAAGTTKDGKAVIVDRGRGELTVGGATFKIPAHDDLVGEAQVSDDVVAFVDDAGVHAVHLDGTYAGETRDASIAPLPNGRFLLARWTTRDVDDDEEDAPLAIAIWTPGAPAREITRAGAFAAGIATSPDGKLFLQRASDEIWLRETSTGRVIAILPSPSVVEAMAFGRDGFVVAGEGLLQVFDSAGHPLWARDLP